VKLMLHKPVLFPRHCDWKNRAENPILRGHRIASAAHAVRARGVGVRKVPPLELPHRGEASTMAVRAACRLVSTSAPRWNPRAWPPPEYGTGFCAARASRRRAACSEA